MKYSAIHKAFIIDTNTFDRASMSILYAMKQGRIIAGVSLGKRKVEGQLQPIDHFECAMLSVAQSIGIDFGVEWGYDLDLSESGA